MRLEPVLVEVARHLATGSGPLSSARLGKSLDVSQQSASRYLNELEAKGWINRKREGRRFSIEVTDDGYTILERVHFMIGSFLNECDRSLREGIVVSGIGEGAYYIGEYSSRIKDAVGYIPYNGTLNLRINEGRAGLQSDNSVDIGPFLSGGRTFGRAELIPINLAMNGKSHPCHVIIPERTHHRLDIEIVADRNLREFLGIKDGDIMELQVL